MAARMAIGEATKPQFFHNFQSAINTAAGDSRLAVFKASASLSSSPAQRKLVLYSKPGCCLCDGLREKLDAAFSRSPVRDITTNPEWGKLYQFEIPVLARVREDGVEETLPRLSPRLGVELVQKKIAAAFAQ